MYSIKDAFLMKKLSVYMKTAAATFVIVPFSLKACAEEFPLVYTHKPTPPLGHYMLLNGSEKKHAAYSSTQESVRRPLQNSPKIQN